MTNLSRDLVREVLTRAKRVDIHEDLIASESSGDPIEQTTCMSGGVASAIAEEDHGRLVGC
jgi:hypothetical protein